MKNKGYNNFEHQVILVISGAERNTQPEMGYVHHFFQDVPDDIKCCIILAQLDSWEYTSYHMLYVHRDHPLVDSDKYFLLMDSCTVDVTFCDKMKRFENYEPFPKHIPWIYGCNNLRTSNTYVFNKAVVLNYKDNFGTAVTKHKGINVEAGFCVNVDGKMVCGVKGFGRFLTHGPRWKLPPKDIYGTGSPRSPHWYPCFGIKKWILLNRFGDFDENIEKITSQY